MELESPLPSNDELVQLGQAINWRTIEDHRLRFNQIVSQLAGDASLADTLPLDQISEFVGAPVKSYFPQAELSSANILYIEEQGYSYVLGSYVSARYRKGEAIMKSMTPYNLNPAINHTNLNETDTPTTRLRALGAEIELGLLHADGSSPTDEDMLAFEQHYQNNARRLGITPHVDHEACRYQVETHIAPSVGYLETRQSLDGILQALVASSESAGVITALLPTYPTESDFAMSNDPKVQTAVDLMLHVNSLYPEYPKRLAEAHTRYHCPVPYHHVEMFRLQGCHIHLDIAGRSEALGLFAFYTMLRSASASANAAVLKGGPFANGVCDTDRLCLREYLRHTTITGNYIHIPTSPHLSPNGMDNYAGLLNSGFVNAPARAMLIDYDMNPPISAMHNPLGRVRPDLRNSKRICTVESTGMPANISSGRMAAVLTDFEFSHTAMELYFRKHGTNLEPMYEDKTMWSLLGSLPHTMYLDMHEQSDRFCTDMTLKTATGEEMSLAEFYDRKRVYMHKALFDVPGISPRNIDDVYMSFIRMLEPASGQVAHTIEQYIVDPKLRSTGNWGQILRNAFLEEGGVLGKFQPNEVLRVVNRVHNALRERYLVAS